MISCNQHDTNEIDCMYQFPIRLKLKTGEIVKGTTRDTTYNADREECIKIENDSGVELILLDSISTMQVTVDNPHIDHVSFENDSV